MPEELTGDEKIAAIRKQIMEIRFHVRRDIIRCPYCGLSNEPGEPLCCSKFSLALRAVLDRLDVDEGSEQFDRIAQRVN